MWYSFKKVTALILLIIPELLFGQNGYFDNNPIWQLSSGCDSSGSGCIINQSYNYYVNGDTSFNSHTYFKLFKKGTSSDFWAGGQAPPWCQGGYIFDDTINPVAFLRDTLNEIFITDTINYSDQLLYDFNLSIGDTLPFTYNHKSQIYTVISIDSVRVSNLYRKRFKLSANSLSNDLIEGIGHERGLLETMDPILECGYNLLCYGLGDSAYYPTIGSTCNLSVGIKEFENYFSLIKVFPNPTYGKFHLSVNTWGEASRDVFIYDVFGKQVYQNLKTNKSDLDIDISQNAKGVYLVKVVSEGKVFVSRIVYM